MSALVPWRRSSDHTLLPDDEAKAIPTSLSEVKLASESTYLSVEAVARSVEDMVTMAMTETDSATSFINKHRDKFSNFCRKADCTGVSEFEALKIGIFERGLTPELLENGNVYVRTAQVCRSRATARSVMLSWMPPSY